MEGKTAAEKAAEDDTREQEAPSWVESVGAGAAWSAVKNIVGTGHGHGHGAGGKRERESPPRSALLRNASVYCQSSDAEMS